MKKLILLLVGMFLISLTMAAFPTNLRTGLESYFSFDETSGSVLPNLVNVSNAGTLINMADSNWVGGGLIDDGLRFNDSIDGVNVSNAVFTGNNFTISFWFNNESFPGNPKILEVYSTGGISIVNVQFFGGDVYFVSPGSTIISNVSYPGEDVNAGWTHIVLTQNASNNRTVLYMNGDNVGNKTSTNSTVWSPRGLYIGNDNTMVAGANSTLDELGIWGRDLNQSEVLQLYNAGSGLSYDILGNVSVSLTSPADSNTIDDIGINFSASYVSIGNLNLTNATYYLWNSTALFNNSVTMIVTNQINTSSRYIDDFVLDVYTWNVYACAQNTSITICNFASTNYTLNVGALEGVITYLNRTYETSNQKFTQNITLLAGATLYNVNLVYNGTSHDGTYTDLGGDAYDLDASLDLPISPTFQNLSFFWRLTYEKDDGSFLFQNLTARNQTVGPINMSFCKSSDAYNDNRTLNFTSSFEVNETDVETFDFYGTFQYWLGTGKVRKNLSVSKPGINNVSICINPRNLTYYSDTTIQYEKTSYVKRNYYLVNASLTNSTNDIALFLLDTTLSTTFIIDVIDSVRVAVADAYIYIQRYYPGTNSFHTVEMARTDEGGSTVGHFEAETEDYKIIIIKDGSVVYESETQKITKKETPYTLTFQIEAGPSTTWQNIGDLNNLVWSLTFNNDTSLWTYTYVDTSGTTEQGRLWVYTDNPSSGKSTICNVTSTSSAATLTCDVSGYNETTYAAAYISRSPEILVWISTHVKAALRWVFSYEGLFWGAMIIMALGFMGYATGNPSIGIIMTVVGVIGVNIIGLVSFGLGFIFAIIAIAIILLWEMKS